MTLASPPPEWQERAACIGIDTECFFLSTYEREADAEAAKAVCRGCDVRNECLTDAIERRDQWAILGGTTPNERRRMRKSAGVA